MRIYSLTGNFEILGNGEKLRQICGTDGRLAPVDVEQERLHDVQPRLPHDHYRVRAGEALQQISAQPAAQHRLFLTRRKV
jgi:hypothetical protein